MPSSLAAILEIRNSSTLVDFGLSFTGTDNCLYYLHNYKKYLEQKQQCVQPKKKSCLAKSFHYLVYILTNVIYMDTFITLV